VKNFVLRLISRKKNVLFYLFILLLKILVFYYILLKSNKDASDI